MAFFTAALRSRVLRALLLVVPLAGWLGATARATSGKPAMSGWDRAALGTIDPEVFGLAMSATSCAVRAGAATHPGALAVIDYSKPSTVPRLWVYDLNTHTLIFQELVAHGSGSGENVPTRFSNDAETHESSLGLFVTEGTYIGKNGYSLRLNGLDAGFNDHALARDIVMHGASYVSEKVAHALGRLGRSWGCPALDPAIARRVIDRLKGGSVVFAYYPNHQWLSTSKYLGACAAAH